MGFFSPISSLALLLTLPIIALYMLRPRSDKKVVPSNFLWKKTLDAMEIERLDKRLIRNWLFYLQMAAVICGALFLMGPYFNQMVVESEDVVILIDQSASMATLTEEGSRLEVSKEAATELLKGLKGQPSISIFEVGNEITTVYKGTQIDQGIQGINRITQSEATMDVKALEGFIKGYEQSAELAEVFMFTDEIAVASTSVQYNVNSKGENRVTILKSSQRRGESKDFIKTILENHSDVALSGELMIYGNDQLLKIEELDLASKETVNVSSEIDGFYDAYRIEYKAEDDYVLDNTYFISVTENRPRKVLLLGHANRFLEEALTILPSLEIYKTEALEVDQPYDLYVYNGLLPEELPASGSLLLINPPTDQSFLKLGKVYSEGTIEFDSVDPLWRHVPLDFNIREVRSLVSSIGKEIMTIDGQTVVAKGTLGDHPTVVVGFDLLASDFPIRIGFPVFIHNATTYLLGNLTHKIADGVVGEDFSIVGDPRATERILLDNEGVEKVLEASYAFDIAVDRSGFYMLEENDGQKNVKQSWIAFNVSRKESKTVVGAEGTAINVLSENAIGHKDFKGVFAVLLLMLLFVEWWVYNHGY